MEYRQIVAVTGLPGLYQLVSTKNDGAFVRSLADNGMKFVSSRLHQLTPLESIEIYTYSENARLHDVLEKMKADEAAINNLLSTKKITNDQLKAYFSTILPDFDQERVYASDIKKILKWFELLKKNNLLNFQMYQQATEDVGEIVLDSKVEDSVTEEPKKAKKATKKAAKVEEEGTEEKPAKKAAVKKTAKKKED